VRLLFFLVLDPEILPLSVEGIDVVACALLSLPSSSLLSSVCISKGCWSRQLSNEKTGTGREYYKISWCSPGCFSFCFNSWQVSSNTIQQRAFVTYSPLNPFSTIPCQNRETIAWHGLVYPNCKVIFADALARIGSLG